MCVPQTNVTVSGRRQDWQQRKQCLNFFDANVRLSLDNAKKWITNTIVYHSYIFNFITRPLQRILRRTFFTNIGIYETLVANMKIWSSEGDQLCIYWGFSGHTSFNWTVVIACQYLGGGTILLLPLKLKTWPMGSVRWVQWGSKSWLHFAFIFFLFFFLEVQDLGSLRCPARFQISATGSQARTESLAERVSSSKPPEVNNRFLFRYTSSSTLQPLSVGRS